jgi:hypothetical protein
MNPPTFLSDARRRQLLLAASYFVQAVAFVMQLYSSPHYFKQDYHTSKLTGREWVRELMEGHPERIQSELGVSLHVFLFFVHELRMLCGIEDSNKGVTVEEQAAIFLYMCVTGLSIRHVGERFQRSNETISRFV